MLLFRAVMLWFLVVGQVVGGAFVFRRLFPRESPWLGFIVPEIAFVLACCFLEHHVALTFLPYLFPVIPLAALGVVLYSPGLWHALRLPSLVFMGALTFTLALRFLYPNILAVPDGVPDISLISAFCMGQTLPVDSTWDPPVKLMHYYFLEHYAASVLVRLFSLDIGTGFNLCSALLSAYIYFFTAATAWRLGRGSLRVMLLTLALTVCAATGLAGYLWLTLDDVAPVNMASLYSRFNDLKVAGTVWRTLPPVGPYNEHQLMVPGYWSWTGAYHSAAVGQLLIAFCLYALVELLRRKRTDWPWICLAVIPLLMLACCAWGMPLAGLFFLGGLLVCWRRKIAPADWRRVVLAVVTAALLLEPMFSYVLLWNAPPATLATGLHTSLLEFAVQWWPLYLPWLVLLFAWRRVHPAVRIALVVTPLAFAAVETFNIGQRYDMTGKLWGMIYGAGWIVSIPALILQRGWVYRVVLALVILASALSLCSYCDYFYKNAWFVDAGHLEGLGPLRWDIRKAHIYAGISQLKGQTIIPERPHWSAGKGTALAHFTLNRSYVAYSIFSDYGFYTNGQGEAQRREDQVAAVYDGKCPDALAYLRQRNIAALVIYPDDNIPDDVVENLKHALSPLYEYDDYRDGDPLTPPSAGIFFYRPSAADVPH